jgi:hypothetical protein
LGDAPIEEQYVRQMEAVASVLDKVFNGDAKKSERKTGFVLMVFPFEGFDGRCNYLSNGANRDDIVTLMKEMIARFEGMPEMQGRSFN